MKLMVDNYFCMATIRLACPAAHRPPRPPLETMHNSLVYLARHRHPVRQPGHIRLCAGVLVAIGGAGRALALLCGHEEWVSLVALGVAALVLADGACGMRHAGAALRRAALAGAAQLPLLALGLAGAGLLLLGRA